MRAKTLKTCSVFAFALVAFGCSGSDGGREGGGDDDDEAPLDDDTVGDEVPVTDEDDGGDDGVAASCSVKPDGWRPVPMRRLSAVEFDNAVADLLGDRRRIASETFPSDEALSGFAANTQVTVGVPEAEKLSAAARSVAEGAASRLGEVLKCSSGQGDEACALSFIDRFGRLAFRRDLTTEERDTLVMLYKDKAKAVDHTQGVRLVIEATLQMAPFLYRPVVGAPTSQDGVNKLTGDEMASRLSFFLWSSVPDEALLDAAKKGDLDGVEGVRAQVDRMMKDARFERTLESFSLQWLGLAAVPNKDDTRFPDFTPEVWASGKASVAKFFTHVVKDTDAKLGTLFTDATIFADGKLAKTYGVSVRDAASFEKLKADGKQRAGIMTQAAVLARLAGTTESSPVQRGVFMRSQILCQAPPPPPPNGVPPIPPEASDKTQRQRLEEHRNDPVCASCHAFFDPLGVAFEHYDGVGVFRNDEHGNRIDASGELTDTDVDGNFVDAIELMNRLKESETAASCMTSHVFRFAVGRLEAESESCVLKRLTQSLAGGGYSLREMFTKLATSDAFRFLGGS